jgi:hypothetical protein
LSLDALRAAQSAFVSGAAVMRVIVTNGATIGELLGRPTDLADVNGQAMTPQ